MCFPTVDTEEEIGLYPVFILYQRSGFHLRNGEFQVHPAFAHTLLENYIFLHFGTYNFSVFQVVGAGIQSDYIFFHGVIRQFVVGNDDIGIGGSFRFEYLYFYFILRNQPEAFYSPFITDVSQLTQDNGGGGAGVGFINSHVQFFHGRFAEFPVR